MEHVPEPSTFRWKWLLVTVAILAAVWWGYRWVYPSYEPPLQPVPNGYTELLRLSNKLARRTGWYNQMPEPELEAVVAANAPILDKTRQALREECVVLLDWQADRQWFDTVHLKNISSLKELSRAFAAEGLLAIKRGDGRLAINSGLENLHLSKAVAHGGLGTDWLSGVATATVGLMTLRDACEIATADDCQFVLKNLPNVCEQFEPPTAITEREWYFFRRINGVWETFLMETAYANNRADFEKRMEHSLQVLEARADLLELHYLIRAFVLKEGRLPRSLSEVADREGLVYQASGDSYFLYHLGPDGSDDGGTEDPRDPSQGDVLLETNQQQSTELSPAN